MTKENRKPSKFYYLSILCFFVINKSAFANCNPSQRADGCSLPGGIPAITTFKEACNHHDICYATLGRSKNDCDNEFYENLKKVDQGECLSPSVGPGGMPLPSRGQNMLCFMAAGIYYEAVKNHGQSSYDRSQEWARRECQ